MPHPSLKMVMADVNLILSWAEIFGICNHLTAMVQHKSNKQSEGILNIFRESI